MPDTVVTLLEAPWYYGRFGETLAKERIERDDEDLVRLYLTDIGQYPLLTKDDEVRLAQAIEAGRAAELDVAKAP